MSNMTCGMPRWSSQLRIVAENGPVTVEVAENGPVFDLSTPKMIMLLTFCLMLPRLLPKSPTRRNFNWTVVTVLRDHSELRVLSRHVTSRSPLGSGVALWEVA